MTNLFNKLNANYYLKLILIIGLLSIVTFLSLEKFIHPLFKHFSFVLLLLIAFYFFPIRIVLVQQKNTIISHLLICVTLVYIGLCSFLKFDLFENIGKILISICGLYSFYLLFNKNDLNKEMFRSHFLLNFILMGVVHMIFRHFVQH